MVYSPRQIYRERTRHFNKALAVNVPLGTAVTTPDLGFSVRQRLAVAVGGVALGQMALHRDVTNGHVIGDLTSKTASRRASEVAARTSVTAVSLGCALR